MEIRLDLPEQIVLKGDYVVLKPDVSEEDFWKYSNEDTNFELIDGVLVIHSPATTEHEEIFHYLHTIMSFYLSDTKKGKIFGSRLVMRLSEKWSPEPDLLILTPDKYAFIKETRIEGPADIVIEILSKATREIDLTKKLPKYLNAGVHEVWIFDPQNKTISIHTREGTQELPDPDSNARINSTIFPDLPLQVNWIWHRDAFPVHEIIRSFINRAKNTNSGT